MFYSKRSQKVLAICMPIYTVNTPPPTPRLTPHYNIRTSLGNIFKGNQEQNNGRFEALHGGNRYRLGLRLRHVLSQPVKSPWFSLNHISHLATVEIRVVRLGSFQNLYLSFAIVEITHGVTANRDDNKTMATEVMTSANTLQHHRPFC